MDFKFKAFVIVALSFSVNVHAEVASGGQTPQDGYRPKVGACVFSKTRGVFVVNTPADTGEMPAIAFVDIADKCADILSSHDANQLIEAYAKLGQGPGAKQPVSTENLNQAHWQDALCVKAGQIITDYEVAVQTCPNLTNPSDYGPVKTAYDHQLGYWKNGLCYQRSSGGSRIYNISLAFSHCPVRDDRELVEIAYENFFKQIELEKRNRALEEEYRQAEQRRQEEQRLNYGYAPQDNRSLWDRASRTFLDFSSSLNGGYF